MGAPGLPCEEGVSPPLRSSQVGASGPHDPHGEGAPPLHPGGSISQCEGLRPSALPKWGPPAPTTPMRRALRPSTPGGLSLNARGCAPLHSPRGSTAPTPSEERALRPSTPGDFPVAGKVTKGAPRAAALWNPASAKKPPSLVLRFACTRATFCH